MNFGAKGRSYDKIHKYKKYVHIKHFISTVILIVRYANGEQS